MSNIIGPSFLALQVSNLEDSKTFYTQVLGLEVVPNSPLGAVVFDTKPIQFAIREPNIDLAASTKLGWGVVPWLSVKDLDQLVATLNEKSVHIISGPQPGPFGTFIVISDPDGYTLTFHQEN